MSRGRNISAAKVFLIGLPLALVFLLTLSAWWLLKTSSGAAWLWGQVEDAASGSVHSSHVDGDLASGFIVQNLEYLSDTADLSIRRVEIEAEPGWWPLTLQVPSLVLSDVKIVTRSAQGQVEDGKGALDIQSTLETLQLRVPVKIHAAEATNITIQTGDESPHTLVESLRFSAGLDEKLVVNQFELRAADLEVNVTGQLALEAPFDLSVAMEGLFETGGGKDVVGMIFPFRLDSTGNLDRLDFTLVSTENGLELGTELLDMSISGSVSTSGLLLRSAALTGSGVNLDAAGTVDWSSQIQAGLSLAIHQLDLSPWLPDWPAGEKLLGNFELDWSESGLKIPVGNLSVAGTDMAIQVEADVNDKADSINARVDWNNLGWPLADTSPDFFSPSGSLNASGSIDKWKAGGQLDIRSGDYPQGRIEIEGGGNRTSTRIVILNGDVLGGSIRGEAGADWANGLAWDMVIRARGVDPEPLLPGWPGHLDAEFEAAATSRAQRTRLKLVALQGAIRGVQVSGHGGLSVEGDTMTFDDVEIRTDEAVLRLDGATSDPAGARLKFSGYLPSMLVQGASGNVELEGRYSSDTGSSVMDVQLEALDLAWNGLSVKGMAVDMQTTGIPSSVPIFQLDASGLAWQDMLLDDLSLSLEPAGEKHRLKANLAGDKIAMSTAIALTPESNQDPFTSPWHGVLDELVLAINQAYSFELQEPASLEWLTESLSVGPVCLRENSGAGLCVNGSYQVNGDWLLVTDVTAIPLDYLRDILDLDVHFEQFVEGRLEWHQLHDQAPTGGAEFRIAAGRILDLDDDVLAETSEGRFGFSLKNGNLESGVLDIAFPGAGFIDVDFDVLDIIDNGERKLQGRAITRLDEIKQIGQLALPAIDEINGQFESNIQLGGTLTDPSFAGGFKLSNGFVRYTPIGLNLENIEFEGLLEKRDRGALKGGFQAGEGIGSVDGRFVFEDFENVQIDIALTGDQLLLVNTDDLKINTETDLRFGLSPQRMDINGHIRIPSARLTPSNLLLEKVSDSEDLVIEARNAETLSDEEEKLSENQIYGQLEVAFGDDVFVAVPGVETSISGSVLFNWKGDPVPLADGNYKLHGKVDAYGPTLEINNGSISFPGVPADNPLLNIRAERDVYGNTQIRSAGVRVIGTLKRPVLEAYTVPVTNEDRAWTLLVTGTDFDQGQGVGGFDVGTYIAPKLYVSYGISLFEDENVISARYDLKKGFGVKVTSGQRETGLDVSYTIDR